MTKMIFLILPVKDLAKATRFYEAIGCTRNPQFSGDEVSSMVWSDTITFMLHTHKIFKSFTTKEIADTTKEAEAMFVLSRDSRAEVDALLDAVAKAGGKADVRDPSDSGWMVNRTFEDTDGHIFDRAAARPLAARSRPS